jgi:hypothetical protein
MYQAITEIYLFQVCLDFAYEYSECSNVALFCFLILIIFPNIFAPVSFTLISIYKAAVPLKIYVHQTPK